MDDNYIDKIMKPYWDDSFKDSHLTEFSFDKPASWNGLVINRPNGSEKLIVGNAGGDSDEIWYYDGNMFSGHNKLFNLEILDFNRSMVRYLNRKYNLEIKVVI